MIPDFLLVLVIRVIDLFRWSCEISREQLVVMVVFRRANPTTAVITADYFLFRSLISMLIPRGVYFEFHRYLPIL